MAEANQRHAVVTGANKGIGFEICKQLASNGIVVILTARDEKRGLEAVEKLKQCGLSDHILFHQLDVADTANVVSLAYFIKTRFGKLDILVNNAGVLGVISDGDAMKAFGSSYVNNEASNGDGAAPRAWGFETETEQEMASKIMTQNYDLAEECLRINYYSTKRMTKALLPLLQSSDAPKYVKNEWAKEVLGDAENLTEERVDEVLNEYLKDFKEGYVGTKSWPQFLSAYILSKAAINAYTRILAKKYPSLCINSICPGNVRTNINCNTGYLSVEEGAESSVRLALLPKGAPSGCFFVQEEKSPF